MAKILKTIAGCFCAFTALGFMLLVFDQKFNDRISASLLSLAFAGGAYACFKPAKKGKQAVAVSNPKNPPQQQEVETAPVERVGYTIELIKGEQVPNEYMEALQARIKANEERRTERREEDDKFFALSETAKTHEAREDWDQALATYDAMLELVTSHDGQDLGPKWLHKSKAQVYLKKGDLLAARECYCAGIRCIELALQAGEISEDRATGDRGVYDRAIIKIDKKLEKFGTSHTAADTDED